MRETVNKRSFLLLLCASLVSVACVFPYVLTVQGDILKQVPMPIWALFGLQFVQCIVLFSIAIFFGLFFTKRIGFTLPLLEPSVPEEERSKLQKNILATSVFFGVFAAGAIYLLDALFTLGGVAITTHQSYAPIWQTLLAATYGGVTEEILMRLFLMAFFVWIGMKLFRKERPNAAIIVSSIFLAAIIFGLGHLPLTASLTTLTPLVVMRAIILNGVGGVIFGWLFWGKGFESSMIAHFTADIFLLTILPLLLS
jgi:hypothetical protein